MKSITIRGIDADLDQAVKSQASNSHQSINKWIITALKILTGLNKQKSIKKFNDLDILAGGWTKSEAEIFKKNTDIFEVVDKEIWK